MHSWAHRSPDRIHEARVVSGQIIDTAVRVCLTLNTASSVWLS
jgi:hypothetical protein